MRSILREVTRASYAVRAARRYRSASQHALARVHLHDVALSEVVETVRMMHIRSLRGLRSRRLEATQQAMPPSTVVDQRAGRAIAAVDYAVGDRTASHRASA